MNLRFDGKIPFTFKKNQDSKQKAKCSFSEIKFIILPSSDLVFTFSASGTSYRFEWKVLFCCFNSCELRLG